MEFQKILSGKQKPQIIHAGYRLQWNRGTQGPIKTTYFSCTTKSCKATLATVGDLEGDLALKYHKIENHTHQPDANANIVAS